MATVTKRSATVTLPQDNQVCITRDFAAPRHLVYRAYTTPELVARWWHADRGTVESIDIDLRVGGAWRYVLQANAGFEVAFHGEFREIVPDQRLVSTEVFEGMPEAPAVTTAQFTDIEGGSRLTILVEHLNRAFRDAHVASGMEEGMQDALDHLEELAVAAM